MIGLTKELELKSVVSAWFVLLVQIVQFFFFYKLLMTVIFSVGVYHDTDY